MNKKQIEQGYLKREEEKSKQNEKLRRVGKSISEALERYEERKYEAL